MTKEINADSVGSRGIEVFENYFDAQGAAAFLKVSRQTIYSYLRSGVLKGCRLGLGPRGRIRISRAELDRYMARSPAYIDRQLPEDL